MTTGQLIKAARKKAGLTQVQLAQSLNIPFQSVSQWERDIRNPKYETLYRISKALNTSISDLLNRDEMNIYDLGVSEGQDAADFYNRQVEKAWEMLGYTHSDTECDLIEAFSQLNDDNQQKVKTYAQDLAKIPEYQRQKPSHPTPAPPEGKDPTPPGPGPESPENGG